ncbi:MAG: peptidyl-prolyl cis-trans isomerase [Candidatus Cloacimonas sp.]|nr:peptidyl-prolyl cis-trans isomerase [Candidatus Cloacimonadota bacterium]
MSKLSRKVFGLRILLLTVILLITIGSISAEEAHSASELILAEFDEGVITKTDFEKELTVIPEMYRARFTTLEGQLEFLESIAMTRLTYRRALELNIDKNEATIEAMNQAIKPYYVEEYRKREIADHIEISKDEIKKYFEDHPERFRIPADAALNYLMTDSEEKGIEALEALKSDKMDFIDVLNQYCTNNYALRTKGVLRNIRNNGYIPGVGIDDTLDTAIWDAPLNEWQGPLTTKTGTHIFKVTLRSAPRQKTLSEVEEEIIDRLMPIKEIEGVNVKIEELKKVYNIEIDNEVLDAVNLIDIHTDKALADKIVVNSSVEGLRIDAKQLAAALQQFAQLDRTQPDDPEKKLSKLNELIRDNLFYYEAKQKDYFAAANVDSEESSLREVATIKRNVVTRKLIDEAVVYPTRPTDEELLSFYEENIDKYSFKAFKGIQYFVFNSKKEATQNRKKVLNALKDNDSGEEQVLEILKTSLFKEHTGTIPQVYKDDNEIQGVGEEPALSKAIWSTKLNELSKVGKNSKNQFFFVRVVDESEAKTYQFEELRGRIMQTIWREKQMESWNEFQEDLFKSYNLVIHNDRLSSMLTAKELFSLAEEAQKRKRYSDAIKHYNQIIDNHKNNDDDYKALFMKAFLIAEEMGEKDEALALFKQILSDYPTSDLHESAEFMIRSLEDETYDIFEEFDRERE